MGYEDRLAFNAMRDKLRDEIDPFTSIPSRISKADVLRHQIQDAQRELMALEAIPDPASWEDGTVVRFTRIFDPSAGHAYRYAAIKAVESWHLTGSRSRKVYTDNEFRELLAHEGTSDVQVAMSWGWPPVPAATGQRDTELDAGCAGGC